MNYLVNNNMLSNVCLVVIWIASIQLCNIMNRHGSAAVHWHINELTSRIVAESGNPGDRYHLGKMVLQGFKDAPEYVHQIDGATGQSETQGSMLRRTVRCATAMKKLGLQVGDVIIVMGPNHMDLAVPFYAGLYLGVVVSPLHLLFDVSELQYLFNIQKPKMVFCQNEKAYDVQEAFLKLGLDAKIITFEEDSENLSLANLLENYGEYDDNFKATDINTEESTAFLLATSGTTGVYKVVVLTHKNITLSMPYFWINFTDFPTPMQRVFISSPLQWGTSVQKFLTSPILRFTRIQTALPLTADHARDMINKYRPSFMLIASATLTSFMKASGEKCDFTCFDMIILTGNAVHKEVYLALKNATPRTLVVNAYGLTEVGTSAFKQPCSSEDSCGVPFDCFSYRIADRNTGEEITEPNVIGELCLKGPSLFVSYYNNPEGTKKVITPDGWFKTGDLFYRDEYWNFYFVERISSLVRCNNIDVLPGDVERLIMGYPGVQEVAVTSIPDFVWGELPVACVVRAPGSEVTAHEIKDLVEGSLKIDDATIGVSFMQSLPLTPTSKINRKKLKELAPTMLIE